MRPTLSVLKSLRPTRVGKVFFTNSGGLAKAAVSNVAHALATPREISSAAGLASLLCEVTESDDLVITLGGWIGGDRPFEVVTEAELAGLLSSLPGEVPGGVHEVNGRRVAARLKRGFEPSEWILFDADNPEGMPPDWCSLSIGERLRLFEPILPGISSCERVELRSSSARVSNTGEFGLASHAYIRLSDPDKLELLRAHVQIEAVLNGLGFPSPRYSRAEPRKVIGHARRTLFDAAVWVPGRLIFCAKPDVTGAPGYVVSDADVRIVNEGGGALDVSGLEMPRPPRVSAYQQKTGERITFRMEKGSLHCTDRSQLTNDTEVEVRGETKPFSEWLVSVPAEGKLRCETPFRASTSEAAFIGRHGDGTPFLFDVGTNTKYCLANEAGAAPPRDLLLRAQGVAAGDTASAVEIVRAAGHLGPVDLDRVLRQVSLTSGAPLTALRAEAKATGVDHLKLAMMVLERVGTEDLLRDRNGFWRWQVRGVWAPCDDRGVKNVAQEVLTEMGQTVTSRLVDGVVDVLGNHLFRAEQAFDLGAPDTVNCLNGELELVDGDWVLRPHRRELYRTTQIPVQYDPEATAPRFHAFLQDVFGQDADGSDKIAAVLEMMGYTLMAHADHERFAVLIGGGANGKSVLLGVLEALCGKENTAGVQPSKFSDQFQRAHLQGKLVNIVTELAEGAEIADAELKAIVSGEPTTVAQKFKAPFTLRPFSTCWFGTNHMPRSNDFSDALFRRALIIPFNRVFSPSEQDPQLKSKLTAELPGILNICLSAYARAVGEGFTRPRSSIAALERWRLETDHVAHFLEEQCKRDFGGEERFSDLYDRYLQWSADSCVDRPLSKKAFSGRLERLGLRTKKKRDGVVVTGAWLRDTPPD